LEEIKYFDGKVGCIEISETKIIITEKNGNMVVVNKNDYEVFIIYIIE
jgi:hypothetical protein